MTELLILPPLIARVARLAPGCRLIVRTPEPHLINATLDLAIIGVPVPQGPFVSRELFEDHFVILARPDHPAMDDKLTPEGFADLPQALVSPTGQGLVGPVDTALERLGLSRRIALSVTGLRLCRRSCLDRSDHCGPLAICPLVRGSGALPHLGASIEKPRFSMRMVWHQMHDTDPAHQWLRGLL